MGNYVIPVTIYIHTAGENQKQAWEKIQEGYEEICSAVDKIYVRDETEFEVDAISQEEVKDNN